MKEIALEPSNCLYREAWRSETCRACQKRLAEWEGFRDPAGNFAISENSEFGGLRTPVDDPDHQSEIGSPGPLSLRTPFEREARSTRVAPFSARRTHLRRTLLVCELFPAGSADPRTNRER